MRLSRFERFAPLTGVVFFALITSLLLFGEEPPDTNDPTRVVVRYWVENDSSEMVASIVGLIASVFFLWFAASLRSALLEGEGGSGRLAALSFGGAVLATSGMMLLFGLEFAVAESAKDAPPIVVHSLSALNNGLFFPFIGGFGVFLLASGLAVLRTGVLPAVAGWLALALGILCFTPIGFFAFLAGVVWVLVVSVMLYRHAEPPATTVEGWRSPAPTSTR